MCGRAVRPVERGAARGNVPLHRVDRPRHGRAPGGPILCERAALRRGFGIRAWFRQVLGQGRPQTRAKAHWRARGHLAPERRKSLHTAGQRADGPADGHLGPHTRRCSAPRPLGLDVSAPVSTWKTVLTFLTSPTASRGFVPKGRTSGLRVLATDQEWSNGDGADIQGPSEALALAILGRGAAFGDLSGDGVALLRSRLK
jgi:hypothetical protein